MSLGPTLPFRAGHSKKFHAVGARRQLVSVNTLARRVVWLPTGSWSRHERGPRRLRGGVKDKVERTPNARKRKAVSDPQSWEQRTLGKHFFILFVSLLSASCKRERSFKPSQSWRGPRRRRRTTLAQRPRCVHARHASPKSPTIQSP